MGKTSKRNQLIAATKTKFYQQGVARTTLADIAQEAQIPLGNVYYQAYNYQDDKLYAFDAATGQQKWTSSLGGTPVIANGVLYFAYPGIHKLYALTSLLP